MLSGERCCPPGSCAYRPSMVRVYLAHIRQATAHGDDPGESADAALSSKGDGASGAAPSGSGLAHFATRIWDTQQARAALGMSASAERIGKWLCPFSAENEESAVSTVRGEAR